MDEILKINENIKINLESELEAMENSVVLRNYKITIENENKDLNKIINIQHIFILCWNDHTVPKTEMGYKAIDIIINLVDEYKLNNKFSSIIVHCR